MRREPLVGGAKLAMESGSPKRTHRSAAPTKRMMPEKSRVVSRARTMPPELRHRPRAGTCRWCEGPLEGRRVTFCSEPCVHEWLLRTDPGYLRLKVFERDKGRCLDCQEDTEKLRRVLLAMSSPEREKELRARAYPEHWWPRSLWAADHIREVAEGGGLCGLENIASLCVPCHQVKTFRK